MAVTDSNYVHNWEVLYVAGYFGVSFWTQETERAASIFEDRVK
jgi:hypothetical protein